MTDRPDRSRLRRDRSTGPASVTAPEHAPCDLLPLVGHGPCQVLPLLRMSMIFFDPTAPGLLGATRLAGHPRTDTLREVHTVILHPEGHQVRQEYLSHLMRGPARATVIRNDNGPSPHYPPAASRSLRNRLDNDETHHRIRQISRRVLRDMSRYATSTLRSYACHACGVVPRPASWPPPESPVNRRPDALRQAQGSSTRQAVLTHAVSPALVSSPRTP